jgi:ribosome biogenesis protein UTP30
VIAISKLRAKYKSYESKRQLFSEHDIFIADDRVVTMLPPILGKAFYERGTKRPIAVSIGDENERKSKEKMEKKMKKKNTVTPTDHSVASPQRLADEITKALSVALVHLSPSTCTAVRVGKASWDAAKVAENIDTVVAGLVTRFVPKGWRNIRALHVKGAETAALPLWLASELWLDEDDIMKDVPVGDKVREIEGSKETEGASKKRKAPETAEGTESPKLKKAREGKEKASSNVPAGEVVLRKERLKRQKAEAKEEAETPVAVKKTTKPGVAGDSVVRVKTKKSKS